MRKASRILVVDDYNDFTGGNNETLRGGERWSAMYASEPTIPERSINLPTAMADLERHPSALVRVLVVDDYEPFRGIVRATLKSRKEFLVVGEAADGSEAVQKAEELQPDLILLDIGLPKLNGLQAAHRICQLAPRATILFVSQENDPDLIAKGYVRKQDAGRDLLPAIEAVLRGDRFVSSGINRASLSLR